MSESERMNSGASAAEPLGGSLSALVMVSAASGAFLPHRLTAKNIIKTENPSLRIMRHNGGCARRTVEKTGGGFCPQFLLYSLSFSMILLYGLLIRYAQPRRDDFSRRHYPPVIRRQEIARTRTRARRGN